MRPHAHNVLFFHLVTYSERSLVRFKCLHPLSVYHVIGDRGTFVVIHLPDRKIKLKNPSASQLLGVLSFADLVLLRSTINVLGIRGPSVEHAHARNDNALVVLRLLLP